MTEFVAEAIGRTATEFGEDFGNRALATVKLCVSSVFQRSLPLTLARA